MGTVPDNDQEDEISYDEYSDHDEQLDDDHSLTSYDYVEQGEVGEYESDEEPNVDGDGVELQENYFGNANDNDYIEDSDEDYVEDAGDKVTLGNPGVDKTVEIPGVGTVREETRRPRRSTREAERFTDMEHSAVFFQAVSQYQNIDATLSTKQYGMKVRLKVFGEAGLAAVVSDIRDNLYGRGVIEPVTKEQVTYEMRKKSLPYLMFLKRKRCGMVKGRRCADGQK